MRTPPVIHAAAATRRRVPQAWFWLGLAAAVAGSLYWVSPAIVSFLPACPWHQLTGWHCPGCGMTRAVLALLDGQLWTAVRLNPLFTLLLPALGLVTLYYRWRGRALPWSPLASWLLLAVILAFGIARNLPFEPFTQLAP